MLLGSRIKLVLALWFAAETLVFVLVARLIGFPEALLLAFLTSLLGWTLLRRAGTSAMLKLRAALDGRRVVETRGGVVDDTLASLGALALLMPGFLSDAAGLIMTVPAARARSARWIEASRFAGFVRASGTSKRRGPATIDLDPDDWERRDPSQGPVSRL